MTGLLAFRETGAPDRADRFTAAFRRFFAALSRARTVRMFVEDRLLFVGTILLTISAWGPIAAAPILPLVDLGSTIGAAGLLEDAALGRGIVGAHYYVNLHLVPYWTVYLLIAFLTRIGGPFVAAKVAVGLAVALLPVSVMRLLTAMGRSPRLGLWVFLLSWDTNLYWGWITFQLGMCLALFGIAKLVELRTYRDAFRLVPLTALIALTHVHAVALTLVAGGLLALVKRPLRSALGQHAVALAGCGLVVAPWLWNRFDGSVTKAMSLTFEWHTVADKFDHLFKYTLDNLPHDGHDVALAAFVLVVSSPFIFGGLPPRDVTPIERAAPLVFLASCFALYLALPYSVSGPINHWYTYPRFATYALIAILCLPRPTLQGRAVVPLSVGLLLAFWLHRETTAQFAAYGNYVRPYLNIVGALPHGTKFLPVDLDDFRFKDTREAVLGQLHGYAASATKSYDPHLFDEDNNPLRFKSNQLPHQPWGTQKDFNFDRDGKEYDYLIVHPSKNDTIAHNRAWRAEVAVALRSGPFTLYRVKR